MISFKAALALRLHFWSSNVHLQIYTPTKKVYTRPCCVFCVGSSKNGLVMKPSFVESVGGGLRGAPIIEFLYPVMRDQVAKCQMSACCLVGETEPAIDPADRWIDLARIVALSTSCQGWYLFKYPVRGEICFNTLSGVIFVWRPCRGLF